MNMGNTPTPTHTNRLRLFFRLLSAILGVLRQVKEGRTVFANAAKARAVELQAIEHVEALENTLPVAREARKSAKVAATESLAVALNHDRVVRDRVAVILGNE